MRPITLRDIVFFVLVNGQLYMTHKSIKSMAAATTTQQQEEK